MGWGWIGRRLVTLLAVLGLGVAGFGATSAAGAEAAAPASALDSRVPDLANMGWQPVFNEEFTRTGINRAVWDVRVGPHPGAVSHRRTGR